MKPGKNGNFPPNTKGHKMSEETKAKMSAAKQRFWSENSPRAIALREKVRQEKLGKSLEPEMKAKISATLSGKRFSEEHKTNISIGKIGKKCTEEAKLNMSISRRVHIEMDLPSCKCFIHNRSVKRPTSIEILLREVILAEFPEVIPYKRFGRYEVDAYLPEPYHLAFEADGDFWHADSQEYDTKRDAYLLETFGLPVVRLWQHEIVDVCRE